MSDPDGMNASRVEWAHCAIDAFTHATGMQAEDKETIMGDLLCDLMHWCDCHGIDFAERLDNATMHYTEETGT